MTGFQAAVGLTALAIFYWGAVAALVGYRLERRAITTQCARSRAVVPRLRPPQFIPMQPTPPTYWIAPEPAWAPYPRPEVLGLAYEPPRRLLVRTAR